MRKIFSSLSVLMCLVLPVAWAGCASTRTQESTGEFVDDTVLTTKVKADLAADKVLSLFQISVESYKGVVQLSGFVDNADQMIQAAAIARNVKGVREVKNSLVIKTR
jgi:osmotically-inducible protein OsmY